jgi:hypothetical protein
VLGLEQILHDSPAATKCVVQRAYEYGVGRTLTAGEHDWLMYLNDRFAEDHYRIPALMRRIATSKAFRAVSVSPGAVTASN